MQARRNDIDMPRKVAGVVVRYLVRCEICGHQVVTSQVRYGNRDPRFVCSHCGDAEPMVDVVRR